VPFLGALFGFAVLTLAAKERNVRVALGGAGAMLLGFASMIAVVVIVMFGSRLGLFYDHFYGFFFAGLPAPAEPTTWGLTAQRWEDLQTMFRLVGGLDRHLIVIAVVPVALLMSRLLVPWRLLPAWISLSYLAGASALYVLLFAALCAGFWLNMRGGSIVYLSYIYVLGWFLLCTFLAFLDRGRLVASLLASIVLVAVSIGGKPGPYLTFVRAQILANTDAARAFDFELARLRAQYRVVADTQHFFKRRFDHDLDRIDMGDGVTGAVRDHAFDAAFDRTVQSYFESLREHPPDIVVLGLVSAPPLKALVQEGYSCIVCGVIFHDRAEGFSLYARNDLPIAELKARFAPFAAPHG
jgi:hypothetical protein